jgi:phenylalanyl-tRNA synthetase alpha chain
MLENLKRIKDEALEEIKKAADKQQFFDLEKKYLGRKGEFTALMRKLGQLAEEERREIGQAANALKRELEETFLSVRKQWEGAATAGFVDVTLPGKHIKMGHIHPISLLEQELTELFLSMGFMVLDGPEVESDYYNFTALNTPPDHPARDMQDTFYLEQDKEKNSGHLVMRTQTSSVQVRAMEKYGAPLKCVVPGRVFRAEALDAVHEHTFYQMEGLMVGKDISLANLISVMKELLRGIFGRDMEVRVRPGYFPFVEPGIELDIKCTICGGPGCPSCKHSGWLELLPAGMVHPNVLKAGGINPEEYSGFAFGLGLTRLAMMRYGIDDIRFFNSGDLRFLEQF